MSKIIIKKQMMFVKLDLKHINVTFVSLWHKNRL